MMDLVTDNDDGDGDDDAQSTIQKRRSTQLNSKLIQMIFILLLFDIQLKMFEIAGLQCFIFAFSF